MGRITGDMVVWTDDFDIDVRWLGLEGMGRLLGGSRGGDGGGGMCGRPQKGIPCGLRGGTRCPIDGD
jgi:hypothetical protein